MCGFVQHFLLDALQFGSIQIVRTIIESTDNPFVITMNFSERVSLHQRFTVVVLYLLLHGYAIQTTSASDGNYDLVFVANINPPGIFVASTATFDFSRIQGLDGDQIRQPIDVDYDPVDAMVYWTDIQLSTISRAFLDGSGFEVVLSDLQTPEGLTLDISNRVMYWTDTGSDLIERASMDGQNRSVVLNLADLSSGTVQPRSIVVDTNRSNLYWTDWGDNPQIERCGTDGSGRRVLVDTYLKWPNGLALDPQGQRLYWCDAYTDRIESSDLLGEGRRILIDLSEQNIEPFDIAVYDGWIFWTDWSYKNVIRMDFLVTSLSIHGSQSFSKAGGLRIYKDTMQDHTCQHLMPCHNGGRCRQYPLHYECVCQDPFAGINCEIDLSVPKYSISCPSNVNRIVDINVTSSFVSWPELNVSDPSLELQWNASHHPADEFPVGEICVVTYTANDQEGNSVSCNFTVAVTGVGLECPSDVTVTASPEVSVANVSWVRPRIIFNGLPLPVLFYVGTPPIQATSDTDGNVHVYSDYRPGDTFSVGVTRVKYRIQELGTNCHFYVTVADKSPPVFVTGCPGNISRLADSNFASASVSWLEVTASDPSLPLLWNRSHQSGDMFPIGGVTKVEYTVTDQAGNSADCHFTVIVTGVRLDCPPNVTAVTSPGASVANVSWVQPSVTFQGPPQEVMFYISDPPAQVASDAQVRVFSDYKSGDTFSIQATRVTYYVQGLGAQCQFDVIVLDVEHPEVYDCPEDVTIPVIASSNHVLHNWTPPKVSDNSGHVDVTFRCSSSAVSLTDCNQAGNGTFSVGVTTIQYIFEDRSKNAAMCSFTVTVTVVNLICPANLDEVFAEPGFTTASVNWREPDLTGWSRPTNFTSSASSGSVFDIGPHEVVYRQWFESYQLVLQCSFTIMVFGQCPANTTYEGSKTLTWRATPAGSTAKSVERCNLLTDNAGQPLALRNCSLLDPPIYFLWELHERRSCGEARNEVTIQDVEEVEVSEGNAVEVAQFLANQTSQTPETADNVGAVSNILENIAEAGSGDKEVTKLVVKTVSNVIQGVKTAPDQSVDDAGSSSAIVQSVETQVSLTLQQEGQVRIRQDTVHVEAVSLDAEKASGGFSFVSTPQPPGQQDSSDGPQKGSLAGTEVKTFENASDIPKDVVAAIRLPASIVDFLQSSDDNSSKPLRASFIVYADDTLFKSARIKGSQGKNGSTLRVAGSVVSLSLEDIELVNLTEPVIIEFKAPSVNRTERNRTTIHCVFWDFDLNDHVGDWSTAGCALSGQTDDRVSCHCNHATNFAILLDVKGQEPKAKDAAQRALDIISQVGCVLSIIALSITVILYLAIRKLRSGISRQIFIHFCVSLLMLYIVFLAGVDNARGSGGGCVFVAALLHYLTLSTMMWMAVEARNMYISTVKVFPEDRPRYMLKACLIAWGSPLIVLIITLAAATDHYQNEHYCFLRPDLVLYLSLLVPIGLILIHNIVIFVLVMRSLLKVKEVSRSQQISKRLQNAVGISALMGLTWCFGFLAIEGATFTFQLIFCVANSLQGVIVFIMFCVRREEVRAVVAPYFSLICCDYDCRLPRLHPKWSYDLQLTSESAPNSLESARVTKQTSFTA
ncbi:uncharacterized protein LOC110978300 isoform X2 [Acanthaster planci]|uniref:Uncharacterized protein LOC110978300 isoform X2 n=1 Tax=Acanthaster planci TaxID=133434 RepID=A0A8B7Y6P8_ACAPL|nr:uncharacterized protein LOC110978300 isoform X2 [Acanthaster planci]